MRWKLAQPWWGLNPRSLDYIPSSITRHASDHQSKASQIYFYMSGSPNKEIVNETSKNMNWICPMTILLNFTICGKMVSFTAWHTAEVDSAQNFHIETTNEVLFLKNAYRSLSRAIFQFFGPDYYAWSSLIQLAGYHRPPGSCFLANLFLMSVVVKIFCCDENMMTEYEMFDYPHPHPLPPHPSTHIHTTHTKQHE